MSALLRRILVCVAAAAAVVAFSGQVYAGAWSQPSGTAPSGHFAYDGGQDLNGCFGDPIITLDDKFVFDSTTLGVSATSGGHDYLADTVMFNIHISPGFNLTMLEVRVYGDYLLQGEGSHINLDATLQLQEYAAQPPNPAPRTFADSLTTTPVTFPLWYPTPPSPYTYTGISTVDVSNELPGVDDDLHVSFTDVLEAWAGATGVANLNLVFQSASFEIILIPEPASLALLALTGLLIRIRRR